MNPTFKAGTGAAVLAMTIGALALALAPGAGAARTPAPATAGDPLAALQRPGDRVVLSDERTVTRWAHAADTAAIRRAPGTTAKVVGHLRFTTEDAQPEVYLVLDAVLGATGVVWVHLRVPARPNGQTGWVPADRLSALYVVRTQLVIDRGARTATLYRAGHEVWRSRVGVGAPQTPTPRGRFYVREVLRGDGRAYGPWAFGTSAYSRLSDWPRGGVVGLHGTDRPQLIPGAPSHGCVRIPNDRVRALKRLMRVGTPVRIVD